MKVTATLVCLPSLHHTLLTKKTTIWQTSYWKYWSFHHSLLWSKSPMRNCFKKLVPGPGEQSLLRNWHVVFLFIMRTIYFLLPHFLCYLACISESNLKLSHSICYSKPTQTLLFRDTNMLFHLIYCHIIDYTYFKTSMERNGNNKVDRLMELFLQGSSSQTSIQILFKGRAPRCIFQKFRTNRSVLRPFNNFPNNPHAGSLWITLWETLT